MSIVLQGSTSGSITLQEPAVAGTNTLSLPAVTGTLVVQGQNSAITSGTAVTASGTAVDFTGIPSWVKRITVMLYGVSVSGTSAKQIQIGSGSFVTTGYAGSASGGSSGVASTGFSSGFLIDANTNTATANAYCLATLVLVSGNNWLYSSVTGQDGTAAFRVASGGLGLSGSLDRVRITTVNGTDTFDAGTINILYE